MRDKYIKTDYEGLVKDGKSKAVLCVDNSKLEAYKRQKKFMKQTLDTSQRLTQVENDIQDIKTMFQQLLEAISNK